MTEELAVPGPHISTIELISRARQALANASTVADLRQIMEVTTVAADAAKRAAKLMEAQGMAAEVVKQANAAANDAAAIRIAAQAAAGRMLIELKERGDISPGHQPRSENPDPRSGSRRVTVPEVLRGDREMAYQNSALWQRVARVPEEVAERYVSEAKEKGAEVTTRGLLRYAVEQEAPEAQEEEANTIDVAYNAVARAIDVIVKHDPGTIAGHASNTRRRTKFRRLVDQLQDWTNKVQYIYDGPELGD